jgi:hypothetical protein
MQALECFVNEYQYNVTTDLKIPYALMISDDAALAPETPERLAQVWQACFHVPQLRGFISLSMEEEKVSAKPSVKQVSSFTLVGATSVYLVSLPYAKQTLANLHGLLKQRLKGIPGIPKEPVDLIAFVSDALYVSPSLVQRRTVNNNKTPHQVSIYRVAAGTDIETHAEALAVFGKSGGSEVALILEARSLVRSDFFHHLNDLLECWEQKKYGLLILSRVSAAKPSLCSLVPILPESKGHNLMEVDFHSTLSSVGGSFLVTADVARKGLWNALFVYPPLVIPADGGKLWQSLYEFEDVKEKH